MWVHRLRHISGLKSRADNKISVVQDKQVLAFLGKGEGTELLALYCCCRIVYISVLSLSWKVLLEFNTVVMIMGV